MARPGQILLALLAASAVTAHAAPVKNGFDLADALIPASDILQGGPPRDGIPAIDEPAFVGPGEAGFLDPDDRVLGMTLGGEARAYPVAILNWHEIVNDRFDGRAVTVSYCPLCGTGVAYRARTDGRELTFGVSGLLYNSNLLMYDRQTESLWSQVTAKAVAGPLKGTQLETLPVTHTSWERWRNEHPDTRVLSTETGHRRDYSRSPYVGYEDSPRVPFPLTDRDDRLDRKAWVLGVQLNGEAKAYPYDELRRAGGEVRDRLAGHELVLRYDADSETATAHTADGEQLPAVSSYWFAWYAFHPRTEVFAAE